MTDIEIINALIAYKNDNRLGVAVTETEIAFHQIEIVNKDLRNLLDSFKREWYYLPSDEFIYISRVGEDKQ